MNAREEITRLLRSWSDGPKLLVAHTDCPEDIAELARFIGSTEEIIRWSKDYVGTDVTLYVAGPEKLVYGIRQILPNATIQHFDYEQDENI